MEDLEFNETANAPAEQFGGAAVATAAASESTAAETKKAAVVRIYDADAQQRQTFEVEEAGEKFETTHVFNALSDDRYFAYDKAAKTIITDGGDALAAQSVEAAAELFDDLIADILGFDGDKPANWKELIDPVSEKVPSVNKLLVCAVVESDAETSGGRRQWGAANDSTVTLEVYLDGEEFRTKHFLRKKSVEDGKNFEKLFKMPMAKASGKGLKGGAADAIMPSQAEAKAKLYDLMKAAPPFGYAGRVPAWHKVTVIDHVFRSSLNAKK